MRLAFSLEFISTGRNINKMKTMHSNVQMVHITLSILFCRLKKIPVIPAAIPIKQQRKIPMT